MLVAAVAQGGNLFGTLRLVEKDIIISYAVTFGNLRISNPHSYIIQKSGTRMKNVYEE